jgi:hypothetical protein
MRNSCAFGAKIGVFLTELAGLSCYNKVIKKILDLWVFAGNPLRI